MSFYSQHVVPNLYDLRSEEHKTPELLILKVPHYAIFNVANIVLWVS